MNEEKIIRHLMMETIDEVDKGIEMLSRLGDVDTLPIKVCLQNIKHYARMIIED